MPVKSQMRALDLPNFISCLPGSRPWPDGGWFFGDDPKRDATQARVFWDPAICVSVLRLVALSIGSVGDAGSATTCNPGTLAGFGHSVIGREGTTHILFERDGKVLQLCVSGRHSLDKAVQLVAEIPVAPGRLKAFLQVQEAFHHLIWNQDFPKDFDRRFHGQRRLDITLKALDGWISGASQKEIAISLFGITRVEADWGRGYDHFKSQVRRLVKRGRWLMEGGYRNLLR